jgi:DNA-binding transcriptional LysR family regulator
MRATPVPRRSWRSRRAQSRGRSRRWRSNWAWQLFRRTRHGVVLTPAGQRYGRQVARWLQVLEQGTLDVMARQGVGGALALAAVPTFATRWLIPRLPLLAQQHPDIVVHLDTQTRPFLFADTAYDAALYAGTPEQVAQWPGTQAQLLLHEDVLPVCSPQLLESVAPGAGGARTSRWSLRPWPHCRCCSKARARWPGASGSTPWAWTPRARWTGRATSCSPCWPRRPRWAWGWR